MLGAVRALVKTQAGPGLQLMDVNSDGINDIILYYNGAVGLVLSEKK